MRVELVFVISSLLITISLQAPSDARSSKQKLRIAGGTPAKQGEFPFMVSILYKGFFTCGGSIISPEWILTAAHCVYNRTSSEFSIVSGTIEMDGETGEETPVSQVIYHEKYTPTSNLANDIAVLRLSVALDYDDNVKPVTLPLYKEVIPDYVETTIMGWGYKQYNGSPSSTLLKATEYVVPNSICYVPYSAYSFYIQPSNVCAGTPQGGVGQCTGDSGGPMVYSEDPTYEQIGIVSFSAKPCGSKYFPGVYTRVCFYRNWIATKCGV